MCQIHFTIQYTDPEGDSLQVAIGRYKLTLSTVWNDFIINLADPKTPDIVIEGFYDLEVKVQDAFGTWSDWFASTFEISDDCGNIIIDDVTWHNLPESNNCYTEACVKVTVPQGEIRNVIIAKVGQANWGGFTPVSCNDYDTHVLSNLTETISVTKIYLIQLDATSGTGNSSTTITVSTSAGNSITMTRTHDTNPAFC